MVVLCFVVSRLYENVGRIVCAGQMVVNLQYWGFACLVDGAGIVKFSSWVLLGMFVRRIGTCGFVALL